MISTGLRFLPFLALLFCNRVGDHMQALRCLIGNLQKLSHRFGSNVSRDDGKETGIL